MDLLSFSMMYPIAEANAGLMLPWEGLDSVKENFSVSSRIKSSTIGIVTWALSALAEKFTILASRETSAKNENKN